MTMKFQVKFNQTDQRLDADFGDVQIIDTGSGGTTDYEALTNKPSIEGVELIKDKSFVDLGLTEVSNQEILEIAKKILGGN